MQVNELDLRRDKVLSSAQLWKKEQFHHLVLFESSMPQAAILPQESHSYLCDLTRGKH